MRKKIRNNWNIVDIAIFAIEKYIHAIIECISSSSDTVDPEEMILAATAHLQNENEELKVYRIPEKVITLGNNQYACPKCKEVVHRELLINYKIKYCPLYKINFSKYSNPFTQWTTRFISI